MFKFNYFCTLQRRYISGGGTVTITGSDGTPIQVPQAVVAQAQLGLVHPSPDGTVTIQGADGKHVKIPQSALAASPSVIPNVGGGKIPFS